jgi:opacity protein-like surface antigen
MSWLRRPALAAAVLVVCAAAVAAAVVLTRPGQGPAGRQPAVVAGLVQAYRHGQPAGDLRRRRSARGAGGRVRLDPGSAHHAGRAADDSLSELSGRVRH